MKKFKENFTVYKDSEGVYHRDNVDENGKPANYLPIKLAVVKPSHQHQQKGQEVYTKRWMELVEQGAPIRAELNNLLRKRKLWNDEMEADEKRILEKIDENLKKIKGRIKLSDASLLMKENIKLKAELIVLRFSRNQLDQNTAEALAEQHRFNYIVAVCTVDDSNKPFFASFEEFLTQDDEGSPVPTMAGEAMWRLTTDTDSDYRKDWPEYQFLQKYKLVDEKFNFMQDGKPVDFDNKPIVEPDKNEPLFGDILDDDGNVIVTELEKTV